MASDDNEPLLLALSGRFEDGAYKASTIRAYRRDFQAYLEWCGKAGLSPLPATPNAVAAFVASGSHAVTSTLKRRVAVIARVSAQVGAPLNCGDPAIAAAIAEAGRRAGPRRRSLNVHQVARMARSCSPNLAGLRDRALVLVGFWGALRRSELASLDVSDLAVAPDGVQLCLRGAALSSRDHTIPLAKTGDPQVCPVEALARWLREADITDGPVFRKVGRGQVVSPTRLSEDGVRQVLRKRAAEAARDHVHRGAARSPSAMLGL